MDFSAFILPSRLTRDVLRGERGSKRHDAPWPKLNLELGRRELQVARKGFSRAVPETWSSQGHQEL